MRKTYLILAGILAVTLLSTSCRDAKTVKEETEENVDDTKRIREEVKDGVKRAGEEVKEAAKDVEEELDGKPDND